MQMKALEFELIYSQVKPLLPAKGGTLSGQAGRKGNGASMGIRVSTGVGRMLARPECCSRHGLGAWPSWTAVTMFLSHLPAFSCSSRHPRSEATTRKGGSLQQQRAIHAPCPPALRTSLEARKVMPQLERHILNCPRFMSHVT